jgi:hypothetical protein
VDAGLEDIFEALRMWQLPCFPDKGSELEKITKKVVELTCPFVTCLYTTNATVERRAESGLV